MPDKTPAEKLKLKSGMTAAILYAPTDVGLGVPSAETPSRATSCRSA